MNDSSKLRSCRLPAFEQCVFDLNAELSAVCALRAKQWRRNGTLSADDVDSAVSAAVATFSGEVVASQVAKYVNPETDGFEAFILEALGKGGVMDRHTGLMEEMVLSRSVRSKGWNHPIWQTSLGFDPQALPRKRQVTSEN